MVTDTIADMLTRIKNAQTRNKESITLPSSNLVVAIAKILKDEGFVNEYLIEKNDVQDNMTITLKYVNGVPAVTEVVRVSKPGIRRYTGYKTIKQIKNGLGVAIFSTTLGVITGKEAVKSKVGGEYLCYVY